MACRKNKIEIVKYLIGKGANIHHKANHVRTILHYACYDGHFDLVKMILGFPEIDVESRDDLD